MCVIFNRYRASKETLQGIKKLYRGSKETLHNIIEYNNINNMSIIYNWEDNVSCECETKDKTICARRSTYRINNKNYCNQHSKPVISKLLLKTNEDKVKEKDFKKPTLDDIKNYIDDKKLNVDAEQFYNYFEVGNWKDSKGNKVKNWKQKLLTWNKFSTKKDDKKKWWEDDE